MRDVRENLVTNCTACSPGRRDAVGHRRPPWATLPPSGAPAPPHPASGRPPGPSSVTLGAPEGVLGRSPAPSLPRPAPTCDAVREGMRWGKGPDVYHSVHVLTVPRALPCFPGSASPGLESPAASWLLRARPGPASRQLRAESRGLSCRAGPTQVPSHPAHPHPPHPPPAAPPPHVATCHLARPPPLQVPSQPRHFPSSLSLWPGSHPPVPSPRGQPLTAPGR